jgi:hypothetical protein
VVALAFAVTALSNAADMCGVCNCITRSSSDYRALHQVPKTVMEDKEITVQVPRTVEVPVTKMVPRTVLVPVTVMQAQVITETESRTVQVRLVCVFSFVCKVYADLHKKSVGYSGVLGHGCVLEFYSGSRALSGCVT